MATTPPSIDEAVERAQKAQEERVNAVRHLAEAQQTLEDRREEVKRLLTEAEAEELQAWNDAVKAGWSETELRKIGFSDPSKKRRSTKKTSRSGSKRTGTARSTSAADGAGSDERDNSHPSE
ncbi:hypothetical protein, partial [Nesterenkonia halophila]